ncbi:MAG: hypothetical protein AAFP76_10425 [Bacteroidota bacterium]
MKKVLLLCLFLPIIAISQVGIGTTKPQATLDVRDPNPAAPTAASGISIPQVDVLPTNGNRGGQILYLNSNNTYYFFDSNSWNPLTVQDTRTYGDVKQGIQSIDHDGWVLLDGRSLTSLTASQQVQAAALGITSNIPDGSGRVLRMQGTLLSAGGASTTSLIQANLPNINFTGATNTIGNHVHTYADRYRNTRSVNQGIGSSAGVASSSLATTGRTSNPAGAHSHSVTVSSGGSNQPISIEDPYLSVNHFIYLGL